jgi:hypothetical protein
MLDAGAPHSEDLFYGTPEFRYRMDEYVVLPDLEEFFFEIVPQVRVEKKAKTIHTWWCWMIVVKYYIPRH